jgi:hypothetical protein
MADYSVGSVLKIVGKVLLTIPLFSVLSNISTAIHESAHALSAIIFGVKISSISIQLFSLPPSRLLKNVCKKADLAVRL